MTTGLAALLTVDATSLSHDERLDHLAAIEAAKAALDARAQHTLHLLSVEDQYDGIRRELEREWVREEVAAVLRLAPVTAHARLQDATALVTRLPRTLALLADGSITMLHARVLADSVVNFDDEVSARIETAALAKAVTQTVAEFRQTVKRAVIAADPRQAAERSQDAASRRNVRMWAEDDGMATVKGYLPADDAQRFWTALEAHASKLAGDGRTADQKRADVLADLAALALQNAPVTWHGRKPSVQVSVALSTLLGLDNQPGHLDGYGPIPASMARRIAADPSSTWHRLITDDTGRLLDYEQTTYSAPAPLRDHIIAEAKTCTFPGCRRPANRNDLDHIRRWRDGGHTSPQNQHPPCERHHLLRHDGRWTVKRLDSGSMRWTTPTGRSFDRAPHTYPVDTSVTGTDPPPF